VIAFIGSVFSPYYAFARGAGRKEPLDHCAVNVALYGGAERRWCMTERGRARVARSAETLAIGRSQLSWDGTALKIHIDEIAAPIPRRVRGVVTLHPRTLSRFTTTLDTQARHRWGPIAPSARVEVAMADPDLSWSGSGYLDSNSGEEPLEECFSGWTWSRADLGRQGSVLLYDIAERSGRERTLALRFDRSGMVDSIEPPPPRKLPGTAWGIERATRADPHAAVQVLETLESGPFYARSRLLTGVLGRTVEAMHESLSLERFRQFWVRSMLPFRMPRALS
jgi:carotenoid 1,2-hydratase